MKLKRILVPSKIVSALSEEDLMNLLIRNGLDGNVPLEKTYSHTEPSVYFFNSPDESLEGWEWDDIEIQSALLLAGAYKSGQSFNLKD